ncbi:MAG: hypothetical protein U0694_08520 [Anaerolineae bacterium]
MKNRGTISIRYNAATKVRLDVCAASIAPFGVVALLAKVLLSMVTVPELKLAFKIALPDVAVLPENVEFVTLNVPVSLLIALPFIPLLAEKVEPVRLSSHDYKFPNPRCGCVG